MGQERLSALPVLPVEADKASKLNNDTVIKQFSKAKSRKVLFLFYSLQLLPNNVSQGEYVCILMYRNLTDSIFFLYKIHLVAPTASFAKRILPT